MERPVVSAPIQIEIEIPSRLADIDSLEAVTVGLGLASGLDPEAAHFFGVALREAVTNAVRHGRGPDPEVPLRLAFDLGRDSCFAVSVRDWGPGFEPESLTNPLAFENLASGRGRGIFFMRRFADEVGFSFPPDGGCEVSLRKRIP